jgi:hypothetical protein
MIGADDSSNARAVELKVMDWAKATQERAALSLTLNDISLFRDALANDPKGTVEAAMAGDMMSQLSIMMRGGPESFGQVLMTAADDVMVSLAQASLYDFVTGGVIMASSILTLVKRIHATAEEFEVNCPDDLWKTTQQFSENIGLAGLCSDEKPERGLEFIKWLKSAASYVAELDATVGVQRHMAETKQLSDDGKLSVEEAVKRGKELGEMMKRAGKTGEQIQRSPERKTPVPNIDDATAMHLLHGLDGESPHA